MNLNLVSAQDALKSFRDMMGRPELMIVGSLSLYLNGFDVEVNDIDLELYNPTQFHIDRLKILAEVSPSGVKNYSETSDKRYDFIYQGIKFNVWLRGNKMLSIDDPNVSKVEYVTEVSQERRHTWWEYYKVSNVISTVNAMRKQGRNKDYNNVMKLMNQILNG